jgi:hypothetical protein
MILSLQSIILKSVELLFESMGVLFDALTTKSLDFSSRASRKEYNASIIFWCIIYSIAIKYKWNESAVLIFIPIFYAISGVAIINRRLHDLNLRGWWQLPLWLFPISGIILCFLKGTPEANRFGDVPK